MDTERLEKENKTSARMCGLMLVLAIVFVLLIFTTSRAVTATADDEERMAALEARVTALEEQIAALTGQKAIAPAETEDTATGTEGNTHAMTIGDPLLLGDGRTITVNDYETGTTFRYSPAGGFSTLSLSAKEGYRLLCLYVTVENNAPDDLNTARLLDTDLNVGADYTNRAQGSFYYLNNRGMYSGGLKSIPAGSKVSGCMLFAVPDDIDDSGERVMVQMRYGDAVYECLLRIGGQLRIEGETEAF